MKILVFDDNADQCKVAQIQLKGHDLTIVSTYDEAQDLLEDNAKYNFDVVLTDLLVPASERNLGPKGYHYAGQEMPLGTTIALLALKVGVKRVAIVTDANHHNHPAAEALGPFDYGNPFNIGDIRMICTDNSLTRVDAETCLKVDEKFLDSPEGHEKYPLDKTNYQRNGIAWLKAWDKVLSALTKE